MAIPRDQKTNFLGGLNATVGQFNMGWGRPAFGLLVEFKNTTTFDVTEVVVTVRNKDTGKITEYPVTAFSGPLPPGAIITGLPEPAFNQIIRSGKTISFFLLK